MVAGRRRLFQVAMPPSSQPPVEFGKLSHVTIPSLVAAAVPIPIPARSSPTSYVAIPLAVAALSHADSTTPDAPVSASPSAILLGCYTLTTMTSTRVEVHRATSRAAAILRLRGLM